MKSALLLGLVLKSTKANDINEESLVNYDDKILTTTEYSKCIEQSENLYK